MVGVYFCEEDLDCEILTQRAQRRRERKEKDLML